jgi:asparagine synthase (glutamine-hydrolysing)
MFNPNQSLTFFMCGIVGVIQKHSHSLSERVRAMADCLRYRGPDDQGCWVEEETGVALAHLRLAIVDISAEGRQPMASASGRYIIVFNGEVYNHATLAGELSGLGHSFRGHSDTEVMLAAFEQWGIEDALKRFIGMFAFALWDRAERRLFLARDRLGIKPLFYCWNKENFLFASELKAFRSHPDFQAEIDRSSLAQFLRYGYVPGPRSIYRQVFKLTPGCLLELGLDEIRSCPANFNPEGTVPYPGRWLRPFWSLRDVALKGRQKMFRGSSEEAVEQLEHLLRESVRLRMIADVPLGAFLSGGVDSSAVVALMASLHSQKVKTFCIGFHESSYDEADFARAVSSRLGTEHTELYVGEKDLLDVVPLLPQMFDEPFADSSQIPTYLVSKLAREQVTVALSGDGGDELFCGYNRYIWPPGIWKLLRFCPPTARRTLAAVISRIPRRLLEAALLPLHPFVDRPGEKFPKLSLLLGAGDIDELYRRLLALWNTPADLVLDAGEVQDIFFGKPQFQSIREFEQRAMLLDQQVYLPDDNLQKVDRASMRVALEVRVPLLDHRIVEFAARLPLDFKYRDGRTKWILRQILYRHVPPELIERPKKGFSVPIGAWLRGPLREWTADLLNPDTLRRQGWIRPEPVTALLTEHLSGKRNRQHQLWNVLMFQAWLKSIS